MRAGVRACGTAGDAIVCLIANLGAASRLRVLPLERRKVRLCVFQQREGVRGDCRVALAPTVAAGEGRPEECLQRAELRVLIRRGLVDMCGLSASTDIGEANHFTVCVRACVCEGMRSVGRNDSYLKVKRQEGGLFDVLLGEERQSQRKTAIGDFFFLGISLDKKAP